MNPKQPKLKAPDPFFGLKYIAYLRSGLPVNEEDVDEEAIINFAKWQICKVRNVLWNDPIWDRYTNPEILAEFFAIKFDESEDLRKEFEAGLVTVKQKDLDWFDRMEKRYQAEKQGKINSEAQSEPSETPQESAPIEPIEFEDKF